jgi:peptide/nickel transport system substrate-binding protein
VPNETRWQRSVSLFVVIALGLIGCAPTADQAQRQNEGTARTTPKTIVITTLNQVVGFGPMSGPSPAGGWGPTAEVHSNGLFTTEATSRKVIGHLAERVPSVDDGSIALLPDGRMRVAYPLRKGVSWHDGTPFTSHDLAFTVKVLQDGGLPLRSVEVAKEVGSVETPDDYTFVAYLRGPYYDAVSHGISRFWPVPQHILDPVYERYRASGDAQEVINHPYWGPEYVHLGPFQLGSWDPSREIVFRAHKGYFGGEPKVDTIRVQVFLDRNAQMAGLLAGTSDVFFENTIDLEQASELSNRWKADNGGSMFLKPSNIRILVPQYRPAYQTEPANLDPRVRAALYHALDREELAEGLQVGHRESAAWGHLLPSDPLFEAGKDTFRAYSYDPARARAILQEAGWTPGPDGVLRHASDGRRYHNTITGPPDFAREISAFAGYWRQIGIDTEEQPLPPAQVRDPQIRATYPSWGATAGSYNMIQGAPATAETRWAGGRSGFDDSRFEGMIKAYENTLVESERFQLIRAIGEQMARDVLIVPLFYTVEAIGVRKGIRAFQSDHEGGFSSTSVGMYARNAHLWDVE